MLKNNPLTVAITMNGSIYKTIESNESAVRVYCETAVYPKSLLINLNTGVIKYVDDTLYITDLSSITQEQYDILLTYGNNAKINYLNGIFRLVRIIPNPKVLIFSSFNVQPSGNNLQNPSIEFIAISELNKHTWYATFPI